MTEKELKKEVLEDDFGSWDWVEQVEKHVPAISAAELMEMTIAPKEFVVREILTPGLSMLGGAPKCGKSWFVLDLCVHVATGEPFLGFPVTKGSAWYISLEDTKEDLYCRLDAITDKELPNLFLSTEDDPIGNWEDGLEKHLNNFIEQNKDPMMRTTEIPYWEKYMLTLREAAEYFHISEKKMCQIVDDNMAANFLP